MAGNVVFVGGGNMAAALIGGLVGSGHAPQAIVVTDPNEAQLARLANSYGVQTTPDPQRACADASVIVWAVKPQVLREAARSIDLEGHEALHVSVAAGVRLVDLAAWFGSLRVVRAMPNTAALVASGTTGLFAPAGASMADRNLAERIFRPVGHVFWVDSDEMMDAVTAVSGSGPAYVFHFLEAFQRAAEELGFPRDRARELVLLTSQGAIAQALKATEPLTTLRERVTSKKGTTEAALRCLDARNTQAALVDAVKAAAHRARELADEISGRSQSLDVR